jgi:hypothetical protein
MARYLILANQTLGGTELQHAVRERIERSDASFYIVVPMIEPRREARNWSEGSQPASTFEPPEFEAADKARKRARHRLNQMVEAIKTAGGTADGEVGQDDPVGAAKDVLERESFDEVIVSTLPARVSRWLKMDLPSRISRMTDLPVTTIEAKG